MHIVFGHYYLLLVYGYIKTEILNVRKVKKYEKDFNFINGDDNGDDIVCL